MTNKQLLTTRKKAISLLITVLLIIGLITVIILFLDRYDVYTDDAYVNGNSVQLMSQIPGTVISINTDDTQLVNEGQVLIQLDPTDTNIALDTASANLADTVRQVKQIYENAEGALATLQANETQLKKAKQDWGRRKGLVGDNAVSREEWQHIVADYHAAKAQYDVALHNFRSLKALIKDSHLYTHPRVERAKAELKVAYVNAKRTTILAPTTGYVAKRNVQVGQQIMPNTPLLVIVPLREIWVDANYKESQLKDLRIGQAVNLQSDAYADVTYHGKIFGLSAGTGAAFSLLPPQNATGNWIKIVQRLPVRIELDVNEIQKHPLQLGLSMHVTTNVRNQRGHRLAPTAQAKKWYGTDIYANQEKQADQLIQKILRENSWDMQINWDAIDG